MRCCECYYYGDCNDAGTNRAIGCKDGVTDAEKEKQDRIKQQWSKT